MKSLKRLCRIFKEGKHIVFISKWQERYTRAKTLGEDYTEENIVERISQKTFKMCKDNSEKKKRTLVNGYIRTVKRMLVSLDSCIMINIRKQQIKNVKELAGTLLLLRRESINKRMTLS
ncbi:MAG: hypothetical protein GX660_15785 [Clostridiaceae bacterium]|nr:hypothetical protein [Clostridiaceae bacterium]